MDKEILLTITGAAGNWVLDVGFDLAKIIDIVDWINVMTYDYFGPWDSKWGAFVGPNAPLYNAVPNGFSGKLNVDYTLKYYSCYTKKPDKIVMGIGFYGHRWENVNKEQLDKNDDLWRKASHGANGKFEGKSMTYEEIENEILNNPDGSHFEQKYHSTAQVPYLYSSSSNTFIAYDNQKSIEAKLNYAEKHVIKILIC